MNLNLFSMNQFPQKSDDICHYFKIEKNHIFFKNIYLSLYLLFKFSVIIFDT